MPAFWGRSGTPKHKRKDTQAMKKFLLLVFPSFQSPLPQSSFLLLKIHAEVMIGNEGFMQRNGAVQVETQGSY